MSKMPTNLIAFRLAALQAACISLTSTIGPEANLLDELEELGKDPAVPVDEQEKADRLLREARFDNIMDEDHAPWRVYVLAVDLISELVMACEVARHEDRPWPRELAKRAAEAGRQAARHLLDAAGVPYELLPAAGEA